MGSSLFLLQENSSFFSTGAHGKWQLVFWSYSPRWLFWAAVNATLGYPGWGVSQRDSEQGPGKDAVSIIFCSLVSTTDPLSCPDRNCLLHRIPNTMPFCKGKNPSFPVKCDPPFCSEEGEDAWSKDGHPQEWPRVGLGAAGAAQG